MVLGVWGIPLPTLRAHTHPELSQGSRHRVVGSASPTVVSWGKAKERSDRNQASVVIAILLVPLCSPNKRVALSWASVGLQIWP